MAVDPFSTEHLIALDSLRVVVMVVSIGIAATCVPIAWRVRNSRQYGCYALASYALFAAVFQFMRLGHAQISPALFLAVVGAYFGLKYCYLVSREIRAGKYVSEGGPR